MKRRIPSRNVAMVAAALMAVLVVMLQSPPASYASDEQIKGTGSSWAYNAINQWISDVQSKEQVVFSPTGSSQGRQDYANGVTDFAVSDIGYQGNSDGANDFSARKYAYLPVVGGGTAFPYHIVVAGQKVRNLRLSQLTLAKIFTDEITNWDDPEITRDNNGRQLPSIPIIPVVHSEGAGTTYQITDWLSSLFGPEWQRFSGNRTPLQYWPSGKGNQVSVNGSDNVISTIASSAGQGTIGFDEYSYALQENLPVANVENKAGYFVGPDQYNVAVALTKAQINYQNPATNAGCQAIGYPTAPCYLLENLSNVWTYTDPRTYPLSSYSYFIEPTSNSDSTMDTGKRQSIVDYLTYSLCQGQAEMGPIGYSPLPVNLVEASFNQLKVLKTADSGVSLTNVAIRQCHNPTFDPSDLNKNELAVLAPQPPLCDKVGEGPCAAGSDVVLSNPEHGKAPTPPAGTGGSGSSGSGAGAGGSGTSVGSSANGGAPVSTSGGASSAPASHGSSAKVVSAESHSSGAGAVSGMATGGATGPTTTLPPKRVIANLAAGHIGSWGFGILVAVLLLLAIAIPPLVTRFLQARRGDRG